MSNSSVPAPLVALWNLKLRLQFTGWLQFVPPAVIGVVCLLLAGAGAWAGLRPALFGPPLVLGTVLLLNFCFEVATLRYGWRPAEPVPERREGLDAFDLMRARRACRSFQARDLTPAHREELLDHVRRHIEPSALLGKQSIRLEYIAVPLTVWPVLGAHEFFVAIAPNAYDRLAVIDVGRSLQKVVLHATRLGLATCWIGPGADQRSVEAHLGDRFNPATDHIICVCAVGYASRLSPLVVRFITLLQHRRLPLSALFFRDAKLAAPLDTRHPPFDRFGRCYEVCQWSPSSFNGQPTRCVGVANDAGEAERFDFYSATSSAYYAPVALGIWCANWETGCEALGISGRFEVLAGRQGDEAPRVDVSWVVG